MKKLIVSSYEIEVHSLIDGKDRLAATLAFPAGRNVGQRIAKLFESSCLSFGGFVSLLVFPVFATVGDATSKQERQKPEKADAGKREGEQAAADVGESQDLRRELDADIS
jgi:hypothetical protein